MAKQLSAEEILAHLVTEYPRLVIDEEVDFEGVILSLCRLLERYKGQAGLQRIAAGA